MNGNPAGKAPAPKPQKSGKPVYDDRIIDQLLGKSAREINNRMKAKGKGETPAYKEMRQKWEELNAAWKRWQKETP
jgi:hypothetical protein